MHINTIKLNVISYVYWFEIKALFCHLSEKSVMSLGHRPVNAKRAVIGSKWEYV